MKSDTFIEKLSELKEILPKGWAKTIAENTDFKPITVYKTLSGKSYNEKILLEAINLAKKSNKNIIYKQLLEVLSEK